MFAAKSAHPLPCQSHRGHGSKREPHGNSMGFRAQGFKGVGSPEPGLGFSRV